MIMFKMTFMFFKERVVCVKQRLLMQLTAKRNKQIKLKLNHKKMNKRTIDT